MTSISPIGGADLAHAGVGLAAVDHLTHNVQRGRMTAWADFYDQALQLPGDPLLRHRGQADRACSSKAMTSPCGKIRIPINESSDDKSQIEEYLAAYRGEGIQHIALSTDGHLRDRRARWRAQGVTFLDTPDTYYEAIDAPPAGPRRGPRARCAATASWSTARPSRRPATAACCCRSSPRP